MSATHFFTIKDLTAIFRVDARTIRRWQDQDEDPLPIAVRGGKGQPNQYDPAAVHQWGVRREVSKLDIDVDGQVLDYTQERAKLAREQRRKVSLEAKVLSGRLVPADEVTTSLERVFSAIRARLLSIPVKTAPQAVAMNEPQIEDLLTTQIHDALQELTTSDFAGTADLHAAAATDGQRVGGSESGSESGRQRGAGAMEH